MDNMISLVARGKWVALVAVLVACGGATQPMGADDAAGAAGDTGDALSEAGAAVKVEKPPTTKREEGPARRAATADAGSAGESPVVADGGAGGEAVEDATAGSAGTLPELGGAGGQAGSGAGGVAGASAGASSGGTSAGAGGSTAGAGGSIQAAAGTGGTAGAGGGSAGAPACVCSVGQCCDGCQFRPSTYRCAEHQVHTAHCPADGPSHWISRQYGDLYCSGSEAGSGTRWVDTVYSVSTCNPLEDVCHNPYGGTPYCGPL